MMEVESKTSILDLNLHVLDKIFDELKELKDKISLGRCHPLLSDAFAFHVRNLFKDLSFLKLDKAELSFILEWCGTTVESIDVRSFNLDDGDLIVRLAAKHCPNLYYIQILLAPENVKTIEQNLADLSQIQYVDLINYSNTVAVDIKNILKTLLKLPDLCGICVETSNWELTYSKSSKNILSLINISMYYLKIQMILIWSCRWWTETLRNHLKYAEFYGEIKSICLLKALRRVLQFSLTFVPK